MEATFKTNGKVSQELCFCEEKVSQIFYIN